MRRLDRGVRRTHGVDMNLTLPLFPFPASGRALSAAALIVAGTGCATRAPDGITQVATIDALLTGVYDGHMTLAELLRHGDLGIGTFEGLDGEMVVLDGVVHQVRSDGRVYRPAPEVLTPFACVTRFRTDRLEPAAGPMDFPALQAKVDAIVPGENRFVALRLRGEFKAMKTRSVPAQRKPYPPLAEVTKSQPVFDLGRVRGTLLGFRSPPFVKGVNVPGYHLHFLADDRSGGGHVLAFELERGVLEIDETHAWMRVELPAPGSPFDAANLREDRTADLYRVEK